MSAMKAQHPPPRVDQRPSVSLRVPPELFTKIEAFRRKQPIRPTLKETVCFLLERGIETTTQK